MAVLRLYVTRLVAHSLFPPKVEDVFALDRRKRRRATSRRSDTCQLRRATMG